MNFQIIHVPGGGNIQVKGVGGRAPVGEVHAESIGRERGHGEGVPSGVIDDSEAVTLRVRRQVERIGSIERQGAFVWVTGENVPRSGVVKGRGLVIRRRVDRMLGIIVPVIESEW
jgi:hypothetical protein